MVWWFWRLHQHATFTTSVAFGVVNAVEVPDVVVTQVSLALSSTNIYSEMVFSMASLFVKVGLAFYNV